MKENCVIDVFSLRSVTVTLAAQTKSHCLALELLEEKMFHFCEELLDTGKLHFQ